MSDTTFTFRPVPTISALDLALIIAASGQMNNIPYDFVRSLPFDVARHFQPNAPQLPLSTGQQFILDADTNAEGAA